MCSAWIWKKQADVAREEKKTRNISNYIWRKHQSVSELEDYSISIV